MKRGKNIEYEAKWERNMNELFKIQYKFGVSLTDAANLFLKGVRASVKKR